MLVKAFLTNLRGPLIYKTFVFLILLVNNTNELIPNFLIVCECSNT